MNSRFYEGWVRHRRLTPREHVFRYRLFLVYLDLDELEDVFRGHWLWSVRRRAPACFRRSDYLGDARVPLKQAVADLVETETGRRPHGPIRLLTHLRYFGYVSNPVSFYYCFDEPGQRVETIVAEITNTPWGERRAYVLPCESGSLRAGEVVRFRFAKDFHVSPFMPMDIDFDWRFRAPGKRLTVHMENRREGAKIFDATLVLDERAISAASAASVLVRFPLMTTKVVVAIYWQAFRLFLKRVPFFTHPAKSKPTEPTSAWTEK